MLRNRLQTFIGLAAVAIPAVLMLLCLVQPLLFGQLAKSTILSAGEVSSDFIGTCLEIIGAPVDGLAQSHVLGVMNEKFFLAAIVLAVLAFSLFIASSMRAAPGFFLEWFSVYMDRLRRSGKLLLPHASH